MIEPSKEFDFTRNDKFYELTIPYYSHSGNLVLYEVHLRDLVQNKLYVHSFRYKELKEFHENLLELKVNWLSYSLNSPNFHAPISGKRLTITHR